MVLKAVFDIILKIFPISSRTSTAILKLSMTFSHTLGSVKQPLPGKHPLTVPGFPGFHRPQP